ncbi:unnamed protein product [Meloidogyne enterolobii]|uniref:Uncharacterized protein n=1 Tax=Meloidogyne enterolobii TaxID=390850 RepID=A0ACB1A1J5_MELEN
MPSLDRDLFLIIISILYTYSFQVTTFLSICILFAYYYFLFVCTSFQLPEHSTIVKHHSIKVSFPIIPIITSHLSQNLYFNSSLILP